MATTLGRAAAPRPAEVDGALGQLGRAELVGPGGGDVDQVADADAPPDELVGVGRVEPLRRVDAAAG